MHFPFLYRRTLKKVPDGFIYSFGNSLGNPDVVHLMGGDASQRNFRQYQPASHIQRVTFPSGQSPPHIVYDELEVIVI